VVKRERGVHARAGDLPPSHFVGVGALFQHDAVDGGQREKGEGRRPAARIAPALRLP
jgi:hypothetical protein